MYVGFDLGGTQLKYGVIDPHGKVVYEDKADTPERVQDLFLILKDVWNDLKKKIDESILGVGFGFPGIFHSQKQKIIQSPNYSEIDNYDLVPAISRFLNLPFRINNDANMAAYGEYKQGSGKDTSSLIFLTIGTGVGSGVILDGKLWQGACGFAGELGHVTVNPHGYSCNCGSQGCLETEVPAPKIVRNYQSLTHTQENLTAEEVARRAQQGDRNAQNSFQKAGYYLGIGLSIAINFLNPQKIILGGGVMKSEDLLLPSAFKETRKRSYEASFKCCEIQKASLGNKAGYIGAAHWAKDTL
ncbi:ROK family protein [bacterium]|nr:ROK family protein [bacterium]